jgi:hypothetical protein
LFQISSVKLFDEKRKIEVEKLKIEDHKFQIENPPKSLAKKKSGNPKKSHKLKIKKKIRNRSKDIKK